MSYLGPLVLIPLIVAQDNSFAKYHAKQGLVLLIIEVIISILQSTLWQFWMLYQIANLGVFILVVIGIINALKGRQEELPLVGHFAKHFSF